MLDKTIIISGFQDLKVYIEKEELLKSEHVIDNKLHTHTEYEMLVSIKGDEHVIVEKNIYPMTHGDVILVHPHEQHHCVLKSENRHEFFWILIDTPKGSAIASFLDGLKSNYYSPENENKKILIELCEELISDEPAELDSLRILLEILNLSDPESTRRSRLRVALSRGSFRASTVGFGPELDECGGTLRRRAYRADSLSLFALCGGGILISTTIASI